MNIHSIRTKQIFLISLLLTMGFAMVLILNDMNNNSDFRNITEGKISNRSRIYINYIDSYTSIMVANGYATAETGELLFQEYGDSPEVLMDRLDTYLLEQIKRNPTIYGSGIWYEPSLFDERNLIGPYAYWKGDDVLITYEFTDHDFTEDDWYRTGIPENWDLNERRALEQYVTTPYDYGDGHIYITINTIMYDRKDSIIGVSSTDWTLDFLPRLFEDFAITDNTEIFLIDPETGKILYSYDNNKIFESYEKESWNSIISSTKESDDICVTGHQDEMDKEITAYYGYTNLGYILLFLVPDREAYASLFDLRLLNSRNFLIVLIFTIIIFYLFSERIIFKPLNLLRQATKDFGSNSFKSRASINESRDEIGLLALDFNYMADQLEKSFDELKELNQSLEKKVSERTAYLKEVINTLESTQEKLIMYERIAATANMIAGFAHQINTPIGVAITASSYLESQFEADLPEETGKNFKEATGLITNNLKKAADLIKAFKKLSVRQFIEEKRLFNIKEIIENTLVAMRENINEHKISINVNCPEKMEIYTFAGVLSQIIINLTDNSIRHGFKRNDSRLITINCDIRDEMLFLNFSDNGNGIEEDILGKIFDPFYTTGKGLGLGLSIVHNLVTQKLHGNIFCSSIAGSGATFVITIPMDVIT